MADTYTVNFGASKLVSYSTLNATWNTYNTIATENELDAIHFSPSSDGLTPPNIKVTFRYRKSDLTLQELNSLITAWKGLVSQYNLEYEILNVRVNLDLE